jgi:hypothetical protein
MMNDIDLDEFDDLLTTCPPIPDSDVPDSEVPEVDVSDIMDAPGLFVGMASDDEDDIVQEAMSDCFLELMVCVQVHLHPVMQSHAQAAGGMLPAMDAVMDDPEADPTFFPRLDNDDVLRAWFATIVALVDEIAAGLEIVMPKFEYSGVPDGSDLYVVPVVLLNDCRMLIAGGRNLMDKKVFKTAARVVAKAAYLMSGGDPDDLKTGKDTHDMDILVPKLTAALQNFPACKFGFQRFPDLGNSSLRVNATVFGRNLQTIDDPKSKKLHINSVFRGIRTVPFADGIVNNIDFGMVKEIFMKL